MNSVSFRFYAELNDFLPSKLKQVTFQHSFRGCPAVKDLIESLGVPHTEVDLIIINGESTDFLRRLEEGDRISVYPVFESLDIGPLLQVRPEPLRQPRFILDAHLGRLASYLRMVGCDAHYFSDAPDNYLASVSYREKRILLTRDRELLKRKEVTHGYYVRSKHPPVQLEEILRRFDLIRSLRPFQRCMRCNALLKTVSLEEVKTQLPQRVQENYHEFRRCPECLRVYWKGTHYTRMESFIRKIK